MDSNVTTVENKVKPTTNPSVTVTTPAEPPAAVEESSETPSNHGKSQEKDTKTQDATKPKRETDFSLLPRRPGYGQGGDNVKLWANYVQISPGEKLAFHRYTIHIKRLETVTKNGPGGTQQITQEETDRIPSGKGRSYLISSLLRNKEPLSSHCKKGELVTDYKDIAICTSELGQTEFDFEYRDEHAPVSNDVIRYRIRFEKWRAGVSDGHILREPLPVNELLDYLNQSDFAQVPSINRADYSQALNIWLRHFSKTHQFSSELQTVVGSKAYSLPDVSNIHPFNQNQECSIKADLGSGVESTRGFFSSVRLGAGRTLVNISPTHGAFYQPMKLDDWIDASNELHNGNKVKLQSLLAGVRVKFTLPDLDKDGKLRNPDKPMATWRRTIAGLATHQDGARTEEEIKENRELARKRTKFDPPFDRAGSIGASWSQTKFWDQTANNGNGGYIRVSDYLKNKFGHHYPAIRQFNDNELAINLGSKKNPAYYPAGLLHILALQNYKHKLDPNQTEAMIRFAQLHPSHAAQSIVGDGLGTIGLKPANAHGSVMNPGSGLITVNGRKLGAPTIKYEHDKAVRVKREEGKWDLADQTMKYCEPGATKESRLTWAVICWRQRERDNEEAIGQMIEEIAKKMTHRGLFHVYGEDKLDQIPVRHVENETELFREAESLKQAKCNFVFVVITDREKTEPYKTIKRICDSRVGLHTACMVGNKLKKNMKKMPHIRSQYLDNVLLKLNLKLYGVNHTLDFETARLLKDESGNPATMIVGLDVTHPSPGAGGGTTTTSTTTDVEASFAGMVATIDHRLGQWATTLFKQSVAKTEICDQQLMQALLTPTWRPGGRPTASSLATSSCTATACPKASTTTSSTSTSTCRPSVPKCTHTNNKRTPTSPSSWSANATTPASSRHRQTPKRPRRTTETRSPAPSSTAA